MTERKLRLIKLLGVSIDAEPKLPAGIYWVDGKPHAARDWLEECSEVALIVFVRGDSPQLAGKFLQRLDEKTGGK